MTERSGTAAAAGTLRTPFHYADSEREARSNLLIQHLQLGEQVVILEGDPGAGRTHLLRRLLARDDHGLHIHAIQAEPGLTLTEILVGLLENLRLPAAPSESPGRVRQHAIERVMALTRGGTMPVLAIDDADSLEPELLADLLGFREETRTQDGHPLGLMLVGSVRLNLRVADSGGGEAARKAVRVPLHGFHLAGTRAFLEQALRAEGQDVERLLDDLDVEAVHKASGGRPGTILEQARRQLAGPPQTDRRRPRRSGGLLRRLRSPTALVALGVVLAALVSALVYLQQTGPPRTPESATVTDTPIAPADDADEPDSGRDNTSTPDTGSADGTDDVTPSPEPPLSQQANSVRVDDETTGDGLARLGGDTGLGLSEGNGDNGTDNVSEEDATDDTEPEAPAADDGGDTATNAANDGEPVAEQQAQQAGIEAGNTETDQDGASSTAGNNQSPLAQALTAGRQWAGSQPADRWTIQLVGAYSAGTILDWMAEHRDAADLHLLRTDRNGQDWYVVVTGAAASREVARQRRDALPEGLRSADPWVRRLDGLTE